MTELKREKGKERKGVFFTITDTHFSFSSV